MKALVLALIALLPILPSAQQRSATNEQIYQTVATNQNPTSGIRGVLLKSPIRPLSRAGQTNSAPMADIDVSPRSEHGHTEIASQKTDTNGRFAFSVLPGKYTIVPVLPPGSRSRVVRQSIEVITNQFTNIVITVDTGIR